MQEDGTEKVVKERYVVDALSFTEAEEAIIDEMSAYVSGVMVVNNLGKAKYNEIFFSDVDDDDKWYKAKLQFITIDDKSDKEKRSNVITSYRPSRLPGRSGTLMRLWERR